MSYVEPSVDRQTVAGASITLECVDGGSFKVHDSLVTEGAITVKGCGLAKVFGTVASGPGKDVRFESQGGALLVHGTILAGDAGKAGAGGSIVIQLASADASVNLSSKEVALQAGAGATVEGCPEGAEHGNGGSVVVELCKGCEAPELGEQAVAGAAGGASCPSTQGKPGEVRVE